MLARRVLDVINLTFTDGVQCLTIRASGVFRMRLSVVLLFAAIAAAQDPRGSIVGRVSDSSGAMIPDIEVRVVNEASGVAASSKTTSAGAYSIPYLLPGFYTVT